MLSNKYGLLVGLLLFVLGAVFGAVIVQLLAWYGPVGWAPFRGDALGKVHLGIMVQSWICVLVALACARLGYSLPKHRGGDWPDQVLGLSVALLVAWLFAWNFANLQRGILPELRYVLLSLSVLTFILWGCLRSVDYLRNQSRD
ncbi:MAG: hypothetical protein Alpg2KO_08840 [Alphaproteobacteria bacterium]